MGLGAVVAGPGEQAAPVTATEVIAVALALHVVSLTLLVRRGLRLHSYGPAPMAWSFHYFVLALFTRVFWALTAHRERGEAIALLAFTWVYTLLLWLGLPWIDALMGPNAPAELFWPTLLAAVSLAFLFVCSMAGDLLAERVLGERGAW